MSDYLAVEHDAETGDETSRILTPSEVDALMESFDGITEAVTVETEMSTMPFEMSMIPSGISQLHPLLGGTEP